MRPLHSDYAERFGRWLRTERKKRGMNQTQLAARAGTVPSRISHIEKGDPSVSVDMVGDLADALGVPDLFALIEAGYIQAIDTDAAEVATLFHALTGDRREIARRMMAQLREMEERR